MAFIIPLAPSLIISLAPAEPGIAPAIEPGGEIPGLTGVEGSPPVLSSVSTLISNLAAFNARGILLINGNTSFAKSDPTLRSRLTAITEKLCESGSILATSITAYSSLDKVFN